MPYGANGGLTKNTHWASINYLMTYEGLVEYIDSGAKNPP